jgi:hypothetical protein
MFGQKDKHGNVIHDKCGGVIKLPNWITDEIPVVKNLPKETTTMNNTEFEKAFEFIQDKCYQTLIERAKRYATDADRLRNFYNVSKEQDIPVQRIPNLFSAKQREAYSEALKGDIFAHSIELWEEWIVDQINYMILTYAILLNEGGRKPKEA